MNDITKRVSIAKNPNTLATTLKKFTTYKDWIKDKYWIVRQAVAANPNTPATLLMELANDKYWIVRQAVAANPNTPATLLMELAIKEEKESYFSHYIRIAIAKNPNTLANTLEKLAIEKEEDLYQASTDNLGQIAKNILNETSSAHVDDYNTTKRYKSTDEALAISPTTPSSVLAKLMYEYVQTLNHELEEFYDEESYLSESDIDELDNHFFEDCIDDEEGSEEANLPIIPIKETTLSIIEILARNPSTPDKALYFLSAFNEINVCRYKVDSYNPYINWTKSKIYKFIDMVLDSTLLAPSSYKSNPKKSFLVYLENTASSIEIEQILTYFSDNPSQIDQKFLKAICENSNTSRALFKKVIKLVSSPIDFLLETICENSYERSKIIFNYCRDIDEFKEIYNKKIMIAIYVTQDFFDFKEDSLTWKNLEIDIDNCYSIKFEYWGSYIELYNRDIMYIRIEDLIMNKPLLFELSSAISTVEVFRKLGISILVTDGEFGIEIEK